jgi:hypothetical protein
VRLSLLAVSFWVRCEAGVSVGETRDATRKADRQGETAEGVRAYRPQQSRRRLVAIRPSPRTDRLMNAHHVMIREFSATRCDPDNGITVCGMPCHTQVMHGQPDKAEAFYYRHLGPERLAAVRRKGYEGVGAKYGAPHWQAELEHLRRLSGLLEGTE